MISTPALRVAFQLSTTLPARVHQQREPKKTSSQYPSRYSPTVQQRRLRIERLHRRGLTNRGIAAELKVSPTVVGRHLKKLGRKANGRGARK